VDDIQARQVRRRKVLERLNAYDSGPTEDDRRAIEQSERCTELLAEANRWPCTRTIRVVCSSQPPLG
jgi:hypothetical protein